MKKESKKKESLILEQYETIAFSMNDNAPWDT